MRGTYDNGVAQQLDYSLRKTQEDVMVKSFLAAANQAGTGGKAPIRALQAWQYLIAKAHNRQIVRYDELKDLMYYANNKPLTSILSCIMFYCEQQGLPPLTILVVNRWGIPGEGFTTVKLEHYHQQREKVFDYEWFRIMPPSVQELREAYLRRRNN